MSRRNGFREGSPGGGVSRRGRVVRSFRGALATLSCSAGLLFLGAAPALALTEHASAGSFGSEGAGAGQFSSPSGVAVSSSTSVTDPAAGDVYVVDRGNDRVERFDAMGTFLDGFESPPGGFSGPEGIAVDNSENPVDPSAGDVYVVNAGDDVIDKFNAEGTFLGALTEGGPGSPFEGLAGVAVDASGALWVYQTNKQIDEFSDAFANQYVGPTPPPESGFTPKLGSGFAVDSADHVYVIRGNGLVAKLNSKAETLIENVSMTALEPEAERFAAAVAVDLATNDLYMDNEGAVGVYSTTESASTLVERFGQGVLPEGLSEGDGIAMSSSSERVYVTDPTADVVHVFDDITVPDVSTGAATHLEAEGSATLNGVVNPDGQEVTSCEFEYGTETSYGQSAPCAVAPGSGSSPVAVSAEIAGLTPGTVYHYRLVAGNAEGGNDGSDKTFAALAQPRIEDEFVTDATASSATLNAEINPGGASTTYRFEYGRGASYEASIPLGGAATGADVTAVAVSATPQNLEPNTTYHFRVVAVNVLKKPAEGRNQTFRTQSEGAVSGAGGLPDRRAWELVSPPNTLGASIEPITGEGGVIEASEDGEAITYLATAPIEAEPQGNPARGLTQVLARRESDVGWSSQGIATPHETATGVSPGEYAEYKFFSPDLASALLDPPFGDDTPLQTGAPEGAEAPERTIYARSDSSGSYTPLITAANVPPGTEFGNGLSFLDATPDLGHVLVSSEAALTAAPIARQESLYEWAGGLLQLVSLLPPEHGEPEKPAPLPNLGYEDHDVRHAISDDGTRVFWSAAKHLYMRNTVTQQTVQIDASQGGEPALEEHEAVFQTASRYGTRVFFTDVERLTPDSTAKATEPLAADLYEYDVESGRLTDLTIDHNPGESAEVQGVVLGASEEGTYVYLVAHGVLSTDANAEGESPEAGADNLYLLQLDGAGWEEPRFIASLSGEDGPDWDEAESAKGNLADLTARTSPDGEYLAFMSDRRLTGYDNTDAGSPLDSPHADEEVFLYNASTNRTVCASCNPTGERPSGVYDSGEYPGLLVDHPKTWEGRWLAANVPGWTKVDNVHALYQSRYLSNNGRLFFDSADALVPQAVNGKEDVYEYEPQGVPEGNDGCGEASETFSEAASGCIALLSSGTSDQESAFLDASEEGGDVFFLTAARLLPQDPDEAFAVYDAHECSERSPCSPAAPAAPAPCTEAEACRAALSTQPSFPAPPTATLSGTGNVVVPPTAKPGPLSRAQKLEKALKACRKLKREKRPACERQARKRYGAHRLKAGKTSPHRSGGGKGRAGA